MKIFSRVFIAIIAIVTVVPSMTAAYGGGGGVWTGGSLATAPSIFTTEPVAPAVPAEAPREGQVLGASTFRYLVNLSFGSRHEDVRELQERLADEGLYTGPVTGFFGPLTRAAVIRYQRAHNITPAVGFVGPLTRAALNAGADAQGTHGQQGQQAAAGAALSEEQRGLIQEQINGLRELIRGLLAQLRNL